ncbi:hypothetical protein BN8_00641 [Fibrisoma limi BUZ 3]|uniref:Uncharacterized protein n=1 Tax=Fibrisoma limi BUZ 3 TaxID=1185876 RepID=I2GCS4_9BACT|nr:hypothetical protein BN8_00641 [Fibrisoma limi BUZ 3]
MPFFSEFAVFSLRRTASFINENRTPKTDKHIYA